MKKVIILFLFVISSVCIVLSQDTTVAAFSKVEFYGDAVFEMVKSNRYSVYVKYTEGFTQQKIKINSINNTLTVRVPVDVSNKRKASIIIYYQEVSSITGSNGADIYCDSAIKIDLLTIRLMAGSNAHIAVANKEVNATASTGCLLVLTGSTQKLNAGFSANSTLDAFLLKTAVATLKASTGSIIKAYVTEKVQSHVMMKGNISIEGNPKKKEEKKTMGGTITYY